MMAPHCGAFFMNTVKSVFFMSSDKIFLDKKEDENEKNDFYFSCYFRAVVNSVAGYAL